MERRSCKCLINLAPEVGLEPTTLRLTAPLLVFSGLLRTTLSCSLSAIYVAMIFHIHCGGYPEFATILRGVPHKIPHSF
jgi:hypothetical protein